MRVKQVYVNDAVIGEAQTWPDVEKLLREKNVQFEGKPRSVEGPAAFFLHGTFAAPEPRQDNMAAEVAKPHEPVIAERAAAIARGLVRTERAAKGIRSDQGMLRLECLSGGFYWISFDGSGVLRGPTLREADELQAKFIDAMERAGR
jgi:hypothetical protein